MKKIIAIIIVIAGLVAGGVILGDGKPEGSPADRGKPDEKKEDVVKRTRFLMDTYCTIQAPGVSEMLDPLINKAFERMEQVDFKFNILNPASPLYRFNNEGTPITDTEIINLINIAQQVSRESEGAFDITVEPLVKLWGFFTDNPRLPEKQEIQKTLKQVGWQHLVIKDGKVTKELPDLRIDLGGIAKGYALSETIKTLKESGVKSALIEAGGQVHAFGNINNNPWKIGIRNPRGDGFIAGLAAVEEMDISTSGDYERFFEKDGIRYHHILDPKTGYPAGGVMSMSVIMEDPTLADAWSTAFFIMGPEKALKLAESKPGMQLIIVDDKGKVRSSSKMSDNIKK